MTAEAYGGEVVALEVDVVARSRGWLCVEQDGGISVAALVRLGTRWPGASGGDVTSS